MQGICDKKALTEFLAILNNYSVDFTVTVDKYGNSSTYIYGFHDLLCFTVRPVHFLAFKTHYDI